MKVQTILLVVSALALAPKLEAYTDHRGHNVDSLEMLVSGWTPQREASASVEECSGLVWAYYELMHHYREFNGDRSMYFARKQYRLGRRFNWLSRMASGMQGIGLIFYGREQYDSALVYFLGALDLVDRMAAGETSFTSDKRYEQSIIDDDYSSLYGALGNLYNMMDSIPTAVSYYEKAGEIFDRNGWNESNSVLYYNIGETWVEEKDWHKALPAYERSLHYARAAGDSLLVANAYKGIGGLYMDTGRTSKALRYLRMAEEYYAGHGDEELRFRVENLDFMRQVLSVQKRQMLLLLLSAIAMLLLLIVLPLVLRRLRRESLKGAGADAVIEEAMAQLPPSSSVTLSQGDVSLTEREEQILSLMAAGLTSPAIADKLCLSLATIKWYRKKLMDKLDAANSAEVISKAKELGII